MKGKNGSELLIKGKMHQTCQSTKVWSSFWGFLFAYIRHWSDRSTHPAWSHALCFHCSPVTCRPLCWEGVCCYLLQPTDLSEIISMNEDKNSIHLLEAKNWYVDKIWGASWWFPATFTSTLWWRSWESRSALKVLWLTHQILGHLKNKNSCSSLNNNNPTLIICKLVETSGPPLFYCSTHSIPKKDCKISFSDLRLSCTCCWYICHRSSFDQSFWNFSHER